MIKIITREQIENRAYWIDEISRLSGDFGVDAEKVEEEIGREVKKKGINALLGHLRLCGAIPEQYVHDTSEEKLYSKYTDVVIHEAYLSMGFDSIVLKERADVADVECWKHGKPYAIVVCPIYQLPYRTSQIYQQAGARSVCIATYTHLAVFSRYAEIGGQEKAVVAQIR